MVVSSDNTEFIDHYYEQEIAFALYFINYIVDHKDHYSQLKVEKENLHLALKIADRRNMNNEYIKGTIALYDFLDISGNYITSRLYLERVLTILDQIDLAYDLATALMYKGRIEYLLGQITVAYELWHRCLVVSQKENYPELIAESLMNIGWYKTDRGHEDAQKYLLDGLTLAENHGLHKCKASLLLNLGTLYINSGDIEQAKVNYRQALALAKKLKDIPRVCAVLQGLGAVEYYLGNLKKAISIFNEGLVLARELGALQRASSLLNNLGDIASLMGDDIQAEYYLSEGLKIAQDINHTENITFLLTSLGDMATKGDDFILAEQLFSEALISARKIDHQNIIVALLERMEKLQSRKNNL